MAATCPRRVNALGTNQGALALAARSRSKRKVCCCSGQARSGTSLYPHSWTGQLAQVVSRTSGIPGRGNNSFKPKPLRGSNAFWRYTTGIGEEKRRCSSVEIEDPSLCSIWCFAARESVARSDAIGLRCCAPRITQSRPQSVVGCMTPLRKFAEHAAPAPNLVLLKIKGTNNCGHLLECAA